MTPSDPFRARFTRSHAIRPVIHVERKALRNIECADAVYCDFSGE